jgi:hypothetical protein
MRKITIRQGHISQRRMSKIPFMEHTQKRNEERKGGDHPGKRQYQKIAAEKRDGDKLKGRKKQEERVRDCIRRGNLRREHPESSQQYSRLTRRTVPSLAATSWRFLSVPFFFIPGLFALGLVSWVKFISTCDSLCFT